MEEDSRRLQKVARITECVFEVRESILREINGNISVTVIMF